MELINKYFPSLEASQLKQYEKLLALIPNLNRQVNVISRKDVDHLEERHVLHSLSIAKLVQFGPGTRIIDAGTGGGFPGIPLAILFPETSFLLVDSIGKKIRLVNEVSATLELKNIRAIQERVEKLRTVADFAVTRAVTALPRLHLWIDPLIRPGKKCNIPNGLIALKGGNLEDELRTLSNRVEMVPISRWFDEPFFSGKTIVYLKK
jgi:16S rRNA (guanine527-N7)-methyltransferase